MKKRSILVVAIVLILAGAASAWVLLEKRPANNADQLLLLLPDGMSFNDPKVALWLDAASEEGLHLVPVHDSEFVRPLFPRDRCAGLILPDSIHKQASDVFAGTIQNFVANGGKLMLVYDAGSLSADGRYAPTKSRFSDLVGVNFALYDTLHNGTIVWSTVAGRQDVLQKLNIPPGKYYPLAPESGSSQAESTITRYRFEELKYPSFVTSGDFQGKVILHSAAGLVAGEHSLGKGTVLFVNLPLGYLKANTDGLLLHTFLHYFAERMLGVPYLASVPDGEGGLVLNWHVDSNAAIKPLHELDSWSLMKQGPYSIHITAGPDAHTIGDHLGFNVDGNPSGQERIRHYAAMGNAVGSHGGWVHDYFSVHIDKDPPDVMIPFLSKNKDSLERVTHIPVREYSSPSGDQPEWVTHWLEAHGFVGYYFTGNSGMAPTQGYRNGVRGGQNIWAFPISHLAGAAAFEEMPGFGFQSPEILQWLNEMASFASSHHTVRLIYFHPPGILSYHAIIDAWMQHTAQLHAEQRFRWYTITGLAEFLNARKQVNWTTTVSGGTMTIAASHPQNLEHMTWRLPVARFAQPEVIGGTARVSQDGEAWVVDAGPGTSLKFNARIVAP
jgi:hypothetical protein